MKKLVFVALAALSLIVSPSTDAQESADKGRKPQLVAHRGGRLEVDENTIPAFQTALENGITGFELDIHRTADGKYVIIHDTDISRVVDGKGIIEQMTLKQIKALRTREGNSIPTLQEVLQLFGKYDGIYVEFEMKTTHEDLYPEKSLPGFAEDVYSAVTAAKPRKSTYVFSSFDARVLRIIKKKHPDAPLMFITSNGLNAETRAVLEDLGINRMACYRSRTTREEMKKAHKEGLLINLWPNKDAAEVNLSYALGADYICTDRPRLIATLIDEGTFQIKK